MGGPSHEITISYKVLRYYNMGGLPQDPTSITGPISVFFFDVERLARDHHRWHLIPCFIKLAISTVLIICQDA